MESKYKAILVIEDSPAFRGFIMACLEEKTDKIWSAESFSGWAELLDTYRFDAILLGLSGAQLLEAMGVIKLKDQTAPVIVFGENYNRELAIQVMREGAQDYLVKGDFDQKALLRAVCFAIERQKAIMELYAFAIRDELTGLYNRRGFFALAQQQMKISKRNQQYMTLFFADMDNLKQINDKFGHRFGDDAIRHAADILRSTFRSSDIVARYGGDEFVALAIGTNADDCREVLERLRLRMREPAQGLHISLSVGFAEYDPYAPAPLDELIAYADKQMYEQKARGGRGR